MFYLLGRRAGGSCVQRRRSKSGQKVSPQFSELSPHLGILWEAVAKIPLSRVKPSRNSIPSSADSVSFAPLFILSLLVQPLLAALLPRQGDL